MPEFRRYRDSNGAEFTQAVSPELAEKKGWTEITDDDHPAVDTNGKPLRDTPAEPKPATKTAAKTAAQAASNDTKGA